MRIESIAAWCSLALVLGLRPALALDPHTRITQYFHTAWRVQDGAFEAAPNAVAQTADGYIWIGTGSGLVKYDGARFDPWALPPGKSLTDPNVVSLRGSSDGTLWIGTGHGLLSWKNNDLREHLGNRIDAIIEDHKGRIWAARARTVERGGLCLVTGEHPGCFGGDDRMKLPYAVTLAEDVHGNLWVGGTTQLLRWHDGLFESFFRDQLALLGATNGVESVAAAADGSVWVSVPSEKSLGLLQIVDGRPKHVVLDGVKKQEFTSLFVDREGSLWLATADDGLYRFYSRQMDHFRGEDGLSSNTVNGFLKIAKAIFG
jgi:ligand-binding sensor domain-containing protein